MGPILFLDIKHEAEYTERGLVVSSAEAEVGTTTYDVQLFSRDGKMKFIQNVKLGEGVGEGQIV